MCGIVGAINYDRVKSDTNERISRSLSMLTHRGPDDTGIYKSPDQTVWFGHARLSIVDLSQLGHQPMLSDDGCVAIIFNGEIYNHKSIREELVDLGHSFRGRSDTEVIIHAYQHWGLSCLDKFNGAFAIAIYDRKNHKVHFARDRAGEKPFFYILKDGAVYFASELTALMELSDCDRYIDPQALFSYLTCGYVLGERTLLKNARSLRPGHWATFSFISKNLHFGRYWSLPQTSELVLHMSQQAYEDKLECLLEEAVIRQLDCDVPTCILLSGGVDSSLLTALAVRRSEKVKTFTVRFPGHPNFDETVMARMISRHFETEHTEIDGVNLDPGILSNLSRRLDAPINDSSLIPTFLVNEAVSKHCRVSLGGDGADELFGGYKHYSRMLRIQPYANVSRFLGLSDFFIFLKKQFPAEYRLRNWLDCLGLNLNHEIPNIREIFSASEVRQMIGEVELNVDLHQQEWRRLSSGHGSILRNCCLSDFQTYLSSSILVKSDRVSMLNSVEARAPFLDRNVIEFALGVLPDGLRSNPENRKIILKNLCKKLLPKEFDLKRKLGFNLPFGEMIRSGKWRELIFDELQMNNEIISQDYIQQILDKHAAGSNYADHIFGLFMLTTWVRTNGMTIE